MSVFVKIAAAEEKTSWTGKYLGIKPVGKKNIPYVVLAAESEDLFFTTHKGLVRAIEYVGVNLGDLISIRYTGKGTTRQGYVFYKYEVVKV